MATASFVAKLKKQPAIVRLWSDRALTIFAADTAPEAPNLDIRINDIGQIRQFEQTVSWLTRDAFIAGAERRIAAGNLVFTYAEQAGPLLGYGYAQPNARETTYTHVDQRVIWPERTAAIFGGFVHPSARGRALHAALQFARVRHLILDLGMRWVASGVASDNAAALASAAKTDLRPVALLTTRRRFGSADRHAVRYEAAFTAQFPDATT
jgi:L-amino acid N-acyltransferase YncA